MDMRYLSRYIGAFLLIFSLAGEIYAQESYVCIWRNPERTMMRIFPNARDYTTITRKISSEDLSAIEARAGELLQGQRKSFQYYALTDKSGNPLGHIFASSQKGEYGAIEFVFGMDMEKKILGLYIQRSRERERSFKDKAFLNQFIGKGPKEIAEMDFGKGLDAEPSIGTTTVLSGIKKELVAFDILAK